MQLCEQYRPGSLGEVIGQPQAVKRIKAIARRGLGGRAYWIAGASGSGKTTIARLLALEHCDPCNVCEMDAGDINTEWVRSTHRSMQFKALGRKPGRAWIINEAHGLKRDAVRRLLVLLDYIPPHVLFVFTTTDAGEKRLFEGCEDAHPLLSRCTELGMADPHDLIEPFARHAMQVARRENLDGRPLEDYIQLMARCRGNLRQAFQEIEAGAMLP